MHLPKIRRRRKSIGSGRATRDELLWGVKLPPWTEESPARLHHLFCLHQTGSPTKPERDEYSILLCHVVAILFKQKKYDRTLPEVRLDPSDVAQEALIFLLRKTGNGSLRIDSEVRNESERPLVLLRLLYVSIYRFVCSATTEAKRKAGEVASTDYFHQVDSGGLEAISRTADAAGAVALIRDMDEFEDYVCGDIVTRTPAETDAVNAVWLCLSEQFVTAGKLLSYDEMPQSVRDMEDVTHEIHARILARLQRYLRETCEAVS